MEPTTKAYNLDPSSYTFANCMLWGVARAHFNKISAAWEAKAYGAALKHLVLGILEGIPVLGQFLSLAEKRWTRIKKQNMNNTAKRICEQATTLQTRGPSAPRLLVPPTVSTEPKTVIASPPVQPVSSPKPVATSTVPPKELMREPWKKALTDLGLSETQAKPVAQTLDIYTHAHEILPRLFLGDLRAYFSLDPSFQGKHPGELLDKEAASIACETTTLTDAQRKAVSTAFTEREQHGTSNLGIKHVVSVTQFQPQETVSKDDWSRFQPDLDGPGIKRHQVKVDDLAGAWEEIQPQLPEIFEKFEEARQKREPLLIHCTEGKSRSVIVLIAYFMSWGIPYAEALKGIQAVRSQAGPKTALSTPLLKVAKHLFPDNPTETFAYMKKAWNNPDIPYPGIVVLQHGLAKLPQES